MVGALIPADRMVFGMFTCYEYFLKNFKIPVYPRKLAFYATEYLAIFADFCQNQGFWPNSTSDYTIFRARRDLIFYQHTPTYTLSKMGEKEQTKIFIWPLRGHQKSRIFPKISFQPYSVSDYTILRALRDLILNQHTHTYTLSKLVEDAHCKHFIWPLGGTPKHFNPRQL